MKNILGFIVLFFFLGCKESNKNTKLVGNTFGTTFTIIYNANTNYESQFNNLFDSINKSLSTYQSDSDISKINRNESFFVDTHFTKVYNASKEIYGQTEGLFDPTIGNVVNAWKFGANNTINVLDKSKIDSLMQYVGYYKTYIKNDSLVKSDPNVYLDFNAIAKGYAVDVISEFLESKNVNNYLVEIGGEIRVKGTNVDKQSNWKVGIESPNFKGEQAILKSINLTEGALATSGTYRKFKVDDNGNRYSHIIDTETGYPSKTNLLSISVIAENCIDADAYATAFKCMGMNKTKKFLELHPELKVFLIFENEAKEFETLALNGFPLQ